MITVITYLLFILNATMLFADPITQSVMSRLVGLFDELIKRNILLF
jgi:hypothetical protein